MKKIILISLVLCLYFRSDAQVLTATILRDSAGEYSMDLKGDDKVIVQKGQYTVIDALRDCDSVNQIKIRRLSLSIYNYEFNVVPALKKEITMMRMIKKKI